MSAARCPTCSTLRPANAAYCPKCRSPFQGGTPGDRGRGEEPTAFDDLKGVASYDFGSKRTLIDLNLWTGVKLGIGFAIGVALVTLTLWLIVFAVLGASFWGRLP